VSVPLYSAISEKYKTGVLPPAAALEREMEGMGVAGTVKDRARRVFERSAEKAGFFEQGRNRLVMPGVANREDVREEKPSDKPGGGGGGEGRHPFIEGLLMELLEPNTEWQVADRAKWHGSECQLVGRERIDEYFEGDPVWQGEVLIFDLLDNPLAARCYAWEVDGRVTAVLHTGPINSPLRAVQASIMADEPTAG
jgi:hypothetical protein